MGNFIDIIIIGGIAAYLIYRLVSTLGKSDGHKRDPQDSDVHRLQKQYRERANAKKAAKDTQESDSVVDAEVRPIHKSAAADNNVAAKTKYTFAAKAKPILNKITVADPYFASDKFVKGASVAFATIYEHFSEGRINEVQHLVQPPVLHAFQSQLQLKEQNKERWDFELIEITQANVASATLEDSLATICVKFTTTRVEAAYDRDGKSINDTSPDPFEAIDRWDFQRNLNSPSPAWVVVKTKSQ